MNLSNSVCSEQENLRRRLTRAETSYRKEQELYNRMMETGFALEELLNETVSENKKLIIRVKEYDILSKVVIMSGN